MMASKRTKPIDVGLVGCGRIAQTYLQVLSSMPECRLRGVVDVRPNVVESVASQFECKGYTDYRELLEKEKPEAVIVCAPPAAHTEIGVDCLTTGVHVLCEKPLALNSTDAMRLVRTAEKSRTLLMMASKFRYVEDVIKAKGVVESGILGDIVLFENVFCSKVDMRGRWNADPEVSGGGVLIDNGTHSVDIARYLLGPITGVQAQEGRRVQGLDVEDTCRVYLRAASGAMGAVDLSWSIHKERDSYVELFGPEGVLSIGWKGSKFRQSEKLDWVEFGNGYDKLDAFRRQILNFVGTIDGTEMPLITPEGALQSVRVIETAYRSLEVDKWVDVEPPSKAPATAG